MKRKPVRNEKRRIGKIVLRLPDLEVRTDPSCPNTGAISCLLLQVVGAQPGPKGGTHLSVATYIQRLNTGELGIAAVGSGGTFCRRP
jgi:hypothetical protein